MLRTILVADKNSLIITLPDSFLGKQFEVIAFVLEEIQAKRSKAKTFNALKLDTKGFKFNRDEANER